MYPKLPWIFLVLFSFAAHAKIKPVLAQPFSKTDNEIARSIRELLYGSSAIKISVKTLEQSTILSNHEKEWIKNNYISSQFCDLNHSQHADSPLLFHLLKQKMLQCHNTKLRGITTEQKFEIWRAIPSRLSQELAKKYLNLKKLSDEEFVSLISNRSDIHNIIGVQSILSEMERRNIPLDDESLKNTHAQFLYKQELNNNLSTIASLAKDREKTLLHEHVSGTLNFYLNNVSLIPTSFASEKLLNASHQLLLNGHDDVAKTILTIAKMNSPKEMRSDLIFHLLASYLLKNDTIGANEFIKKNINIDEVNDERLLYWIARTLDKNSLKVEAVQVWGKILKIGIYPTYYDYLSAYALNSNVAVAQNSTDTPQSETKLENKQILHRLRLWATLNLNELLEEESLSITNNAIKSNDYQTLNAVQAAVVENKKYLLLFKIANMLETRGYGHYVLSHRFLFPDEFKTTVIKQNKAKLDPLLVMALIRQESAFNKDAQSPVGATGLMQIMPATGKSLNRKVTKNHLRTPETNIKLGIQYLDYLIKKFNSIPDALAAYNAGPHRVSNWRANLQRGDDLLLQIELIPFKETRNYIKYIFRNYASYHSLASKSSIKEITNDFFGSNNL